MKFKGFGLMAPTLLLFSSLGQASTLLGTTSDPLGVDGLVVDGTTYNVAFSTTSYNDFTAGSTLSKNAASTLASVLNTLGVTSLDGGPVESFADEFYLDAQGANQDETQCFTFGSSTCSTPWSASSTSFPQASLGQERPGNSYIEAAVFTPVLQAPEMDPSTALSALTILLGGLTVLRGRRIEVARTSPLLE